MSDCFLFLFAANDSLSFLGHCEWCCSACLWGWVVGMCFPRSVDFSNALGVELPYDIISHFVISKPFDNYAHKGSHRLPPTSAIQGSPLVILLYSSLSVDFWIVAFLVSQY